MELLVFKRDSAKKSDNNRIRLQDGIPAVLYAKGTPNENVFVKKSDFETILRKIKKGNLSTAILTLKYEKKKFKALVKDIQYHYTSYDVIHLDFILLDDKNPVNVNIPIQCIGKEFCTGIKLGGTFRQMIRVLKVNCLPKDIPQEFTLDIENLEIGQAIRLKDINIPPKVKPLGRMNEIAVSIAAKR